MIASRISPQRCPLIAAADTAGDRLVRRWRWAAGDDVDRHRDQNVDELVDRHEQLAQPEPEPLNHSALSS